MILSGFFLKGRYKIELMFFKRDYRIIQSQKRSLKDFRAIGPRFEQTDFDLQPRPDSAIKLIENTPIRFSKQSVVSCNGGDGSLGHPKIYINLNKNEPVSCGYCGIRFQKVL
ncbi:hypothetical protein T552_01120 [Pneumocystis carinii B80]|uniref:Zinc finger CHCC-type domain-containing protein n=1 Tax=Pneumocystis carinii (strain B80) TaxID=1408658 RepID=A0A0W4ZLB0_PNEC8|nr:hypothetical protein T552_01120 [Pneumocystis carinii B80]KTW29163.1 hypothetical protein T552_01120 [Pneumocystis carinii B80]